MCSALSKSLSQIVPQRTNRPSDGANEHLSLSYANEKKYQNTNTDKVRAGSVAGGINEEQLNS